ncbi:DUF3375 domain-containing protein [Mycetocola sp. JXN-3]|uniref:DUF3375 domain-containing protein n=1 Tax=Mycetocola sp. JXN-3 TaxID=2116510 RepID=UPI00165D183B|nr:DUF3375 domain-containing protein [Mycetocola sp. JXN-3]
MSDVLRELTRVRESFDKPTLRLLDRKWAPLVLTIFRTSFSRERQSIHAERLHVQVDTYLQELAALGEEIPTGTGRSLCVQWMNDRWLYRSSDNDGEERYSLTSHALEALALVDSLAKDRALLSESRLTTILDTMHHWATEADPDPHTRIQRLDDRIAELTAERDRLRGGGEVPAAGNERMYEGYQNLIDLIGQLPSDFKRVEESVAAMHRQIISDFRAEERPIGEVLDEYLAKTDELMGATAEGRAFEGAFTLLRNEELLTALRRDIQTILDHPFAAGLGSGARRDFRGTVSILRSGIDDVLSQRRRLTATLREHIENHDHVRDRELDAVLRALGRELETWMHTAGPRSTVPVELLPEVPETPHLRERLWDPLSAAPPPPLEDHAADAPAAPEIDTIRVQGGPYLEEVRAAIGLAARDSEEAALGDLFNTLSPDLRRPVEIFGLLHLLTQAEIGVEPDAYDDFSTIRPDHTARTFRVPRVRLDREAQRALAQIERMFDSNEAGDGDTTNTAPTATSTQTPRTTPTAQEDTLA